jgi:hypothetical protein
MATRIEPAAGVGAVTGRWLARFFLAAAALGSMAWGIVCLPVFLDQIRLDKTKDLILHNVPITDNELGSLSPLLERSAARLDCIPEIDRSSAIIRLRMLENALTPDSHSIVDDRMGALDRAIQKSLGCAPSDPYLWLALFWLRNIRVGFSQANLDLLRMSYLLGPNEGWIILKRNYLALAMLDGLPPDLAAEAIGEFAKLVKSELYTEAMGLLAGPGWPHRDRLMAGLATVPKQNKAVFVKAMADVGYVLDGLSDAERRNQDRP